MDVVRHDLKNVNNSWEEAEELATDRAEWHQCIGAAQRIHQDAG